MFTDIYFSNQASSHPRIAFHHGQATAQAFSGTAFKTILCPCGWSHRFRVPWQLSFRLLDAHGNRSHPRNLEHTYRQEMKQFLISREGTVSVQQSYRNGKQVIDFEQATGNAFCAVQIYRGELLVAETYFSRKHLQFQLDNTVHVLQNFTEDTGTGSNASASLPILTFDISSLRSIHLSAGDTHPGKLMVDKQEQW